MSQELLPCPFCGETCATTQIDENQGYKWGGVVCGCGAQGPEVRTGYDESADAEWRHRAIEQWNTRPTAQAVAVDDLSDAQCDAIYRALDNWASEFDSYEFGLPQVAGGGIEGGREVIRAALRRRWEGMGNDRLQHSERLEASRVVRVRVSSRLA